MPQFFDKLHDVISIQLTNWGKKRLCSGSFNPVYYSFVDTNIIYNSNAYGITGSQNQTVDQIADMLRPKLNTSPSTTDENQLIKFGSRYFTPSMIGSAELGQQKYPAFELTLHQGRFSGSASMQTSTFLNQNISTVNIELICNFDKQKKEFIDHEFILLEVNELNGLFEKENFDIQVYKKGDQLARNPFDIKLNFNTISPNINEQFDGNEDFSLNEAIPNDPKSVEYWFELSFDDNITDLIEFDNSNIPNIYLRPENNLPPEDC